MTSSLLRVESDFAVARPIPWDEKDSLNGHVDAVVDALKDAGNIVEVEVEVRLDIGEVRLIVIVAGEDDEETADRVVRETVGSAIRECDARHFQLLSADEEEQLAHNLPSRSGLLTPLWRLRRLSIESVEP